MPANALKADQRDTASCQDPACGCRSSKHPWVHLPAVRAKVEGRPLVRMRGLGAAYHGVPALSGIDLEVSTGEIIAIVGPNGAGKTTLMRVLAGLHPASVGSLEWPNGRPARIGYVPQIARLDPACPVSVEEFLRLSLPDVPWWRGAERGARDKRILSEATVSGCAHLLRRRLSQLSGGETQRVLLAYARLRDAELLLLDEPQTGLDVATSTALANTLLDLVADAAMPRALVLVSHDLHFVARVATRVVCLRGHLCCVGPTAEMLALHVGGPEVDMPVPSPLP